MQSQTTPGSARPAQKRSPPWSAAPTRRFGSDTRLELGPGVLPVRLAGRRELRERVALVEVALADDRGPEVRRDDAVGHELVGVEGRQRRLVADVVREVGVAVLHVE